MITYPNLSNKKFTPKLKKELELNLNALWVHRCKANDDFLEFCKWLIDNNLTPKWSDDDLKQFEIEKIKK